MKWYLDFGHGGKDSGAVSANKTKEIDTVLKIGMLIKNNLEKNNEKVSQSVKKSLCKLILNQQLLQKEDDEDENENNEEDNDNNNKKEDDDNNEEPKQNLMGSFFNAILK